jgi:hypothetical protein
MSSFDWNGYLTLAEELSTRSDEASKRSAISRAYYFVYNLALERAKQNRFETKRDEATHVQLWKLYGASPDPLCQSLSELARRLKSRREQADYEKFFPRHEEAVPQALAGARRFAATLQKVPLRLPSRASSRQ